LEAHVVALPPGHPYLRLPSQLLSADGWKRWSGISSSTG
jgi:hypothetical protein